MTILTLENISLQLESKFILQNVSYNIQAGDFIIILGTNGSGKSSLLKLLDQRYSPSSGFLTLKHKKYTAYTPKKFSRVVKTLTQNCSESLFSSLTIFENYILRVDNKPKDARSFFSNFLKSFNPNLANNLDQVVSNLSGGEQQALTLALATLFPPEILLLDEHTSALDPKTAARLMTLTGNIVREKNITCVLATHDLNIALNYGNKILALRQGKIFKEYSLEEKNYLKQETLLAACY